MSPGLTTERVYETLKWQIMRGERSPGERLDPARLARELAASATPVRDALNRLLGERLVHSRVHEGFRAPVLTETALRDLYGWSLTLAATALRASGRTGLPESAAPVAMSGADLAEQVAVLFDAIAAASGSKEHRLAMRQTSDRLHAARRIEPRVIVSSPREVEAMWLAWEAGAMDELRRLIGPYHRRRLGGVAAIAALLTSPRGHAP